MGLRVVRMTLLPLGYEGQHRLHHETHTAHRGLYITQMRTRTDWCEPLGKAKRSRGNTVMRLAVIAAPAARTGFCCRSSSAPLLRQQSSRPTSSGESLSCNLKVSACTE